MFSTAQNGSLVIHPLIKNLSQHGPLSDQDRDQLLGSIGRTREVRAKEDIICEGDQPWESTILIEGFAARYKVRANGRRQITAFHVPGDFIDLHSFLLRKMDHGMLAITDCEFAGVPHDALEEISKTNPHLTRLLWMSTVIDGAIHRQWLAEMGGADAHKRTAHLVCELFTRLDAVGRVKENSFELPLTQTDFGDTFGLNNIDMLRSIMKLGAKGIVSWESGVVTVHDIERLKHIAEFDPTYLNLPRASVDRPE